MCQAGRGEEWDMKLEQELLYLFSWGFCWDTEESLGLVVQRDLYAGINNGQKSQGGGMAWLCPAFLASLRPSWVFLQPGRCSCESTMAPLYCGEIGMMINIIPVEILRKPTRSASGPGCYWDASLGAALSAVITVGD